MWSARPPTSNELVLLLYIGLLFIHPSTLFVGHFCPQLCGNPIIFLFSIGKFAGDRMRPCVCGGGPLLYFIVDASPAPTKGTRTNFVGHQFPNWVTQIALLLFTNYIKPQSFTMAVEANWSEKGATPHWHIALKLVRMA
jgi:hypothetical protein